MANNVDIGSDGSLFVDEDKLFKLVVLDTNGVPVNIATWTIGLYVGTNDNNHDVLTKTPATVTGTYDADPDVNTQEAQVSVAKASLGMKSKSYRYSWKRTDDGSNTVLAWGDWFPEKATAP